ncbi:MAG: hypothetical protein OEZ01_07840, partial [Candidatus Heimdallarchaeota archaeon]|nr:hypothetical protein [Candidatus Heimdallarchaeota archaeon]
NLVGIVVYGGASSERVFSGVSDIDYFIILKSLDKLSKSLADVYNELSEGFNEFLDNPLFAALLDYDIYTEDQLPIKGNLNGFSPIRALALKHGELLYGVNPFKDIELSKDELISGARRMIQDYLEKLTSSLFMSEFEAETPEEEEANQQSIEAEKIFLAIDTILSSAQVYFMIQENKYVNMPDVVLYAETKPIDGVDNELLRTAGLLRQGVETEIKDLFNRAINYAASILKLLN